MDLIFTLLSLPADLTECRFHRYVALKILIASLTESSQELAILRHLDNIASSESARYLPRVLDEFKHEGPNGCHICLVFEPMGPTVNSMVEDLPCNKLRHWSSRIRYPLWMGKRILKQSLQGLEVLHKNGIAHGDFQPGNMLFTLTDIDSVGEEKLRQNEKYKYGSVSPLVKRLDGKTDKWAPKYIAVPQPLDEFADTSPGFRIKLSDLGAGT